MPGMFGGIGCNQERYETLKSWFADTWNNCEVFAFNKGLLGAHAFDNLSALHVTSEGLHFAVDGEDSLYRNATRFAQKADSQLFRVQNNEIKLSAYCKGNVAIIEQDKQVIYLAVDWSGIFPLYYTIFDGGLLFSSHLKPLAKVIGASPDPVGSIEFFRYGYILSGRTFFKDIRRLLPGQVVTFQAIKNYLRVSETSEVWKSQLMKVEFGELVEMVWNTMDKAIQRCLDFNQNNALMTSAGWDSRLLLAGMHNFLGTSKLQGFSHGDLKSRELSIITKMVQSSGIKCHLEPVDKCIEDMQFLDRAFKRTESVLFPYWQRAGVILAKMGVKSVSAGILGEVLGGHYGKNMLLGSWEKALFVAAKLLNIDRKIAFNNKNKLSAVYDFFRLDRIEKPWYIQNDYFASIPKIKDEINADIECFLQRIEARGIKNPDQLIEAFITESRGAQYIAAQLLSTRVSINITNIFGDQELLKLSSQIPMSYKIHNILNKAVLQKYASSLLLFPTAAALLPAYSPILFQEITRAQRKVYENISLKISFLTRGYLKPKIYGWDNFEFLSDGKSFQLLLDTFESDIIDKNAVQKFINKVSRREWRGNLWSVFAHFMKIYTTDLMLK